MSLHDLLPHAAALAQVLLIDVTLAGDNAVVVGLAVMGLVPEQRRRAIVAGIAAATVIRLGFALIAVRLITVIGLTLAGGLLLLWVASRMYRELRARRAAPDAPPLRPTRFVTALFRIVLADVSMSLDNVLAVAGAARQDLIALVAGLVFSVILMGAAASSVAALLERHRWVAWAGLLIVLYVALRMIWDGSIDVLVRSGTIGAHAPG